MIRFGRIGRIGRVASKGSRKALGISASSACDGLSFLSVEVNIISGTLGKPWKPLAGVIAMVFSPCLSNKRQFRATSEGQNLSFFPCPSWKVL